MADKLYSAISDSTKRLVDMGDGTWAERVVAVSEAAQGLDATIALAASVSDGLLIAGRLVGGFYIPASFEGGYLQFERSRDGLAWSAVKDQFGAALRYTAASSTFVNATALDFVNVKYLRIVSTDASGTPVVQATTSAVVSVAVGS